MKRRGGVHTVLAPARLRVWCNRVDGRIATVHPTKKSAVTVGRDLARLYRKEHTIHRKDGVITAKNSYGNDAFPPRG
jgi:hypothetical protein